MPPLETLLGARPAIAMALSAITNALFGPMLFFFILFIVRVVLRRPWITAAAFVAILTGIFSTNMTYPSTDLPAYLLLAALYAFVLLRFGLLAMVVTDGILTILPGVPRTLNFSAWYAGIGFVPLVLTALIAYYGFRTSLGGRRILREDLL
jgi:hypothetical protein